MLALALLDKAPRAKAVLALAAQKAGWGQPLPKGSGHGVSLQHAFATYMAMVADVDVAKREHGLFAATRALGAEPGLRRQHVASRDVARRFAGVASALFMAG